MFAKARHAFGGWLSIGFIAACTSGAPHRTKADAGPEATPPEPEAGLAWQQVFTDLPAGLTTVWGASSDDVWVAGTDTNDGRGPMVLHLESGAWVRKVAASKGHLWWVHGFADGPVFFGGSDGTLLRYFDGRFRRVDAPRSYGTVYGVWGADDTEVWAVGGDPVYGTGAFVWRYRDGRFEDVAPLPVPASDVIAYFKVWGTSARDVWIVGTPGILLHYDGERFERVDPGVPDPLFTIHASTAGLGYAAVGGSDLGVLLERTPAGSWSQAALPEDTPLLTGVWLTDVGGFATGAVGTVLLRSRGIWKKEATRLSTTEALHSVWVDPAGGVWAAGGDVLAPPFGGGVLIHRGAAVPTTYTVDDGPPDGASDAGPDSAHGRDSMPDASPPIPPLPDPSDARVDPVVPERSDAMPAGEVRCGSATCTLPAERCCADANTGVPRGCVAESSPCPSGQAPVTCDEPADCGSGHSCCLNRYLQAGALQNVECEAHCVGPSVCRTDGDCGGTACTTFPIMKSYEICTPP